MSIDRIEFGGQVFSTNYELTRVMRRLSYEAGLYSGQPRILTILQRNEGCTLSELSELISIGMPSLSVSLRNMERSGLIRKESEGRSNYLYLTDLGKEKAQAFHEQVDGFFAQMISDLGEAEAEALYAALGKLLGYMRQVPDSRS